MKNLNYFIIGLTCTTICMCFACEEAKNQDALAKVDAPATGLERIKRGEYDAAIVDFTTKIQEQAASVDPLINRATAYLAKGDTEKAILDCNKALELDPNSIWASAVRCLAYRAKHYHSIAVRDCNKAKLAPRFKIKDLVRLRVENKDIAEASWERERIRKPKPKQKAPSDSMMAIINQMLEKCKKGDMASCHDLGEIYYSGRDIPKDPKKAVQFFQKACDGGECSACSRMSFFYDFGLGIVTANSEQSRKYEQMACEKGCKASCESLERRTEGETKPKKTKVSAEVKRLPVSLGRMVIMGVLTEATIKKVVKSNLDQIRVCYSRGMNKKKDLAGKVSIRATVNPKGYVQQAVVSQTSLRNAAIERCMVQEFRTWKFPEPTSGGIVIFNCPFIFGK